MNKTDLHTLIIVFLMVVSFILSVFLIYIENKTVNMEDRIGSMQTVVDNNK